MLREEVCRIKAIKNHMSMKFGALHLALHQLYSLLHIHIHLLVLHEQTGCIGVTKIIWTVVILNGSGASGPLTSGRALNMYS